MRSTRCAAATQGASGDAQSPGRARRTSAARSLPPMAERGTSTSTTARRSGASSAAVTLAATPSTRCPASDFGMHTSQVTGQYFCTVRQPILPLPQWDFAASHEWPPFMALKASSRSSHCLPWRPSGTSPHSSTTVPSARNSATEHSGGGGSTRGRADTLPLAPRTQAHHWPKRSIQSTCVRITKGSSSAPSMTRCTRSTESWSRRSVSRKTSCTVVGMSPRQLLSRSSRKAAISESSLTVCRCGRPTLTEGAAKSAAITRAP
mmetsp:Transcript_9741/g.33051  ORF Transcript_9741/g.33051 Transcript_9741/m.33051 type:complete len:263 (+) Transcript_9741:323-1111(+)